MKEYNGDLKSEMDAILKEKGTIILPPMEAKESMSFITSLGYRPQATMLDPWYNKGFGGVREDYVENLLEIIEGIKDHTNHLYFWGFPEIVALFVGKIPPPLKYKCWLTWYFKNCPSILNGWRSAQQTCLHYSAPGAKMYPEHFFNEEQKKRHIEKKLRFIPGPSSVIEESLLVGFVGKKEQTGHKSQKPEKVYEKLVLMVTKENDLVYDPMCGSGTTGAVTQKLNRKCILSDMSEEYVKMAEKRLGLKRLSQKKIAGLLAA